jgi:Flp pilus assembly pilin Flp
MRSFSDFIVRGRESSRGQTMAEYALILATIAVVAIGLVNNAGAIINALVNGVDSLL